MSATVDRLNAIEAQTAPLPWPVHDFYDMPDDQFVMLVALSQAWPLLREEIGDLESTVLGLSRENAQLHNEHRRLVAGATWLGQQLDKNKELHREEVDAILNEPNLAERLRTAEEVCRSITTQKSGSGGAHGFFDGAVHDEWKRLVS